MKICSPKESSHSKKKGKVSLSAVWTGAQAEHTWRLSPASQDPLGPSCCSAAFLHAAFRAGRSPAPLSTLPQLAASQVFGAAEANSWRRVFSMLLITKISHLGHSFLVTNMLDCPRHVGAATPKPCCHASVPCCPCLYGCSAVRILCVRQGKGHGCSSRCARRKGHDGSGRCVSPGAAHLWHGGVERKPGIQPQTKGGATSGRGRISSFTRGCFAGGRGWRGAG